MLQVVPSLGQVKVLHRRLAAAAPHGGEGPAPFPQLAARWAAAQKGKVFTDQVGLAEVGGFVWVGCNVAGVRWAAAKLGERVYSRR